MELRRNGWVIMTTDGRQIAKSRCKKMFFFDVDDVDNQYDFITYSSKKMAEAHFPKDFTGRVIAGQYKAVECELTTTLILHEN